MKSKISVILSVLVAFAIAFSGLPYGFSGGKTLAMPSNLIEGGDFESTVINSNSSATTGWRYNNNTSATLSTSQANSGAKSAKLSTTASTYGTLSYTPITVDEQRDYTFSFYLYVQQAGGQDFRFSVMSGTSYLTDAKNVTVTGTTGQWYYYEITVNSGSFKTLTLRLQPYAGGIYYIDDVCMKPSGDPFNEVDNGNFENDISSFTVDGDGVFATVTRDAYDGYSLKISSGNASLSQSIALASYTDYVFTYCSKAGQTTATIDIVNDLGISKIGGAKTFVSGEEWTLWRFGFNTGENTQFSVIITAGDGTVLVDNLRLAEKADIIVNASQGGTFKAMPDAGYGLGERVTLTAIPDDGFAVSGWYDAIGALLCTDSVYEFTADDITVDLEFFDVRVKVENHDFELNDLSMYTISNVAGFSVSDENPANGNYSLRIGDNTEVSRYAYAKIKVTVQKNTKYLLRFNARRFGDNTALFKVITTGNTTLDLSTSSKTESQYYINGATADNKIWGENKLTFNSGNNTELYITFVVDTGVVFVDDIRVDKAVSVTASAGEGGVVSASKSTSLLGYGDSVTLYAINYADYAFDGWYQGDDKVEESMSFTFTAKDNADYQARFKAIGKQTNRVVNSDFETAIENAYIFSAQGGFEKTEQDKYSGNSCLMIPAPEGTVANWQNITQTVKVDKSTDYVLEFYGRRAEASTGATFKITGNGQSLIGGDQWINGMSSDYTKWGLNRWTFNSGDNNEIKLIFVVTNGVAFVDDISIRKTVKFTVNATEGCTVSGNTTVGEGVKASFVAMSRAGYEFVGWYENNAEGELITKNQVYEFVAENNRTLFAKYKVAQADGNLIMNGSFEQEVITAFTFAGNTVAGFESSADTYYYGSKSLKISAPDNIVPQWHWIKQEFKTQKNTDYILEFYAKQTVDSSGSSIVKIQNAGNTNLLGNDYNVKGSSTNPLDWGKNTLRFNSGDNEKLYLTFVVAYNTTYIDGVTLKEVPLRTESILIADIPNAGFENKSLDDYAVTDRNGFTVTSEQKYAGNNSLKIFGDDNAKRYANATLLIDVDPNTEYVLRFYGKRTARNADSAIWKVLGENEIEGISAQYWVNGDGMNFANWGLNTLTFNTGDNKYIKLLFVVDKGVAYVDNISLAKRVKVEVTKDEGGTVSGASNRIAYGDRISLIAQNYADYGFKGWFINNVSVSGKQEYAFTATKDFAIHAGFAKTGVANNRIVGGNFEDELKYSWTPQAGNFNGFELSSDAYIGSQSLKISKYSDSVTRYAYIMQNVKVEPNTNYVLSFYGKRADAATSAIYKILDEQNNSLFGDSWVNGAGNKDDEQLKWGRNVRTFNSGNNTTLKILFAVNNGDAWIDSVTIGMSVTLSTYVDGKGKITTAAGKYAAGEIIPLTAKPEEGYMLENWYVGERKLSNENPYEFTIEADSVITAKFIESDEAVIKNFNPDKKIVASEEFNLLKGCDFEGDSGDWNVPTFIRKGVMERVDGPENAFTGNGALHFSPSGNSREIVYFKVKLEANTQYMISFDVRGTYKGDKNDCDMSFGVMTTDLKYLVLQNKKSGYYDETLNSTTQKSMTPPSWDNQWHRRGCVIFTGKTTDFYIAVSGKNCDAYIDNIQLCLESFSIELTGSDWDNKINVIDYNTELSVCDKKYNLVENHDFADLSGSFWNDGWGFNGMFSPFSVNTVDDVNALVVKQKGKNPSGMFYVKWLKVKPNTEYTLSMKVKSTCDDAYFGLIGQNSKRYHKAMEFTATPDGKWQSVGITFDSGEYTTVGLFLQDAGKTTALTDIRLFEAKYGEKPPVTAIGGISVVAAVVLSAVGLVAVTVAVVFVIVLKKRKVNR